jgi:hypothetical protein
VPPVSPDELPVPLDDPPLEPLLLGSPELDSPEEPPELPPESVPSGCCVVAHTGMYRK